MKKQKALIIQNKYLGDVLVSSIIAHNLKKIDPSIEVHFFTYSHHLPVIEHNPYIDTIIHLPEKEFKSIKGMWRTFQKIRKEKYDYVIDPYERNDSLLMSLFSGAKKTVTFTNTLSKWFYSNTIEKGKMYGLSHTIATEDKLILLHELFPKYSNWDDSYKIYLTEEEKKKGEKIIQEITQNNQANILMGIVGSGDWKSYPPHYMATLIDTITSDFEVNILFNYAPHQKEVADTIYNQLSHQKNVYKELIGNSLQDLVVSLPQMDAIIACEGGLVHLAKGLSIPNVNIYSPFIARESWGTMENKPQNESIHLRDYRPDLFEGKTKPEIEANSFYYYDFMTPEMIYPKIKTFLQSNGLPLRS